MCLQSMFFFFSYYNDCTQKLCQRRNARVVNGSLSKMSFINHLRYGWWLHLFPSSMHVTHKSNEWTMKSFTVPWWQLRPFSEAIFCYQYANIVTTCLSFDWNIIIPFKDPWFSKHCWLPSFVCSGATNENIPCDII